MWRCSLRSSPARRAVRTAVRMGYLGPSLCPRRRETALDPTVSPGSRDVQRTFCLVVDEFGDLFAKGVWLVGDIPIGSTQPARPSGGPIDRSVSYETNRYRPCYDRRRATARSDQERSIALSISSSAFISQSRADRPLSGGQRHPGGRADGPWTGN